jgi:mRNA interferase MazF
MSLARTILSLQRGELYRTAATPGGDPRRFRTYVVVSRAAFLDARHSSVVCVPLYARGAGLKSEVGVGPDEGMRQASFIRCDEVTSVERDALRQYVGSLSPTKLAELDRALAVALGIDYLFDALPQ